MTQRAQKNFQKTKELETMMMEVQRKQSLASVSRLPKDPFDKAKIGELKKQIRAMKEERGRAESVVSSLTLGQEESTDFKFGKKKTLADELGSLFELGTSQVAGIEIGGNPRAVVAQPSCDTQFFDIPEEDISRENSVTSMKLAEGAGRIDLKNSTLLAKPAEVVVSQQEATLEAGAEPTEELAGHEEADTGADETEEKPGNLNAAHIQQVYTSRQQKTMKKLSMEKFGLTLKDSLLRQNMVVNSMYKQAKGTTDAPANEKSLIAMKSRKLNFDHLGIRDKSNRAYTKVSQLMHAADASAFSKMVFSDYIHKYGHFTFKQRYIVLITDFSLFLLAVDNFRVATRIALSKLDSITTVTTNASILVLSIEGQADLMLETIRRTELIVYLLNNCENQGRPKPVIKKMQKVQIKEDGTHAKQVVDFSPEKGTATNLVTNQVIQAVESRDFMLASKYGHLLKKSKTWYKSWEERFYVLSNVGLLYMATPTDKEIKLFPFIDFEVSPVAESAYGRKHVFELKTIKGGSYDMQLQAYTQQDYDEWLAAFASFRRLLEEESQKRIVSTGE